MNGKNLISLLAAILMVPSVAFSFPVRENVNTNSLVSKGQEKAIGFYKDIVRVPTSEEIRRAFNIPVPSEESINRSHQECRRIFIKAFNREGDDAWMNDCVTMLSYYYEIDPFGIPVNRVNMLRLQFVNGCWSIVNNLDDTGRRLYSSTSYVLLVSFMNIYGPIVGMRYTALAVLDAAEKRNLDNKEVFAALACTFSAER